MPDPVLLRCLRVALALTCTVSAMTVTPANATDGPATSIDLLVDDDGAMLPISHLVPLTVRAADDLSPSGLTGQLFHATDQNAHHLNSSNIAYINCDPDAYRGYNQASEVVDTAITRGAIAALFFSTSTNYCNVTDVDVDDNHPVPFLYSMINKTTSQRVLEELETTTSAGSQVYFAKIQPSTNGTMSTDNGASSSQSDSNPLGPSPSTAVAMIILYSITGVITTLFLVIIITGAMRAHRHPERYGPGVVLNGGRNGSRQTRVRGIARAMLDTLPVVKFGDQPNANASHEAKSTDVEMGEAASRNSAEEYQSTAQANSQGTTTTTAAAISGAGPPAANTTHNSTSHDGSSGTPAAAAAPPAANNTARSADATAGDADAGVPPAGAGSSAENLPSEGDAYTGCTICTEEFEPGEDVRLLPCNHKFHPACIDPWLLNVSGTCPLCRINLNPSGDTATDPPATEALTRRSASILAPPLTLLDAANIPSPASVHRHSVFRDMLHPRSPGEPETPNRRHSRLSAFFLHRERHDDDDEERPRPPPQEPLR